MHDLPPFRFRRRVSAESQVTDRQLSDLLAAGVRRDDIYIDHGVSGGRVQRPGLDAALDALEAGDTLVVELSSTIGRWLAWLAITWRMMVT